MGIGFRIAIVLRPLLKDICPFGQPIILIAAHIRERMLRHRQRDRFKEFLPQIEHAADSAVRSFGGTNDHISIRILDTMISSHSSLYWALEPDCQILLFMWYFGALGL